MQRVLLITVRFHDGRYHGTGDWPPSPARLFQALVAGIGQEGPLSDEVSKPLEWLERLDPPVIAAPHMKLGMTIPMHFVPNNDLDALGGFAANLPKTRTAFKVWKPKLFDQQAAFHYAWNFDDSDGTIAYAKGICEYAERLYQLGRGIDQAWAVADILQPQQFEDLLLTYRGVVHRPSGGRQGTMLDRPQQGSLKSLKDRHQTMSQRFKIEGQGRSVRLQFAQAPKPRFAPTAYDSPPRRQVFELRSPTSDADHVAWPLSQISNLVVAVRDLVVQRLKRALPEQHFEIEDCLVGRKADGRDAVKTARVRILPLPSIGHPHADLAIRRILVEVPTACLLRPEDIFWAFSGVESGAGGPPFVLTATADESMLKWYGVNGETFLHWRSITPAALPETAQRRRIEPSRRISEAKRGAERATEQKRAVAAVVQALRHAEIPARADIIRVQREPFKANGKRVEAFAHGTRFAKERLWHVDLILTEPTTGPLVIGDGRYYGLGLMVPSWDLEDTKVTKEDSNS